MSSLLHQTSGFRIKSVADITGLSAHVIRKWEQRYGLLHPQRGHNNYRVYSEDDVQLLLFVKSQLEKGFAIGELAQAGERELKQSMREETIELSGIPSHYREDVVKIIQAARTLEGKAIQQVIAKWIGQEGLDKALDHILFPLLRLIGNLWHMGGLSISGEHSVTQCIRQFLIGALREGNTSGQAKTILACVPGDNHEVAPLTAAILLQNRGWQATYLGPNVSFEVLQMALRRNSVDLIILSCMITPERKILERWVKCLAQRFRPFCRVMAGGPGFSAYTDLLTHYDIPYLQQVGDVVELDPKFSRVN